MTTLYGIKNCDTMKKAFAWMEAQKITYNFHDYKKSGLDAGVLKTAIDQHGWENVINRRGTTWRQLPESVKTTMNKAQALNAAKDNPSIIKRPLLDHNGQIHLGFTPADYAEIFKN